MSDQTPNAQTPSTPSSPASPGSAPAHNSAPEPPAAVTPADVAATTPSVEASAVDQPDVHTPVGAEAQAEEANGTKYAFFAIGITFMVLGFGAFAGSGTGATGWTFLPVGITFLILAMSGMFAGAKAKKDPTP